MAERFLSARPHGPNPLPPFPLISSASFGSARSSQGREAAKRTLDGEDRSGTMKREGKGGLWENEAMQSKRDGLVPIGGGAVSGPDDALVTAIRNASPQALAAPLS